MEIGNKTCDICGEPLNGKVIGMFKGTFQDSGDEGKVERWDVRLLAHEECILSPDEAKVPLGVVLSYFELDTD